MHVTDTQGHAVAQAFVTLRRFEGDPWVTSGSTDANGRLEFTGLRAAPHHLHCISAAGRGSVGPVDLRAGEVAGISLVLRR